MFCDMRAAYLAVVSAVAQRRSVWSLIGALHCVTAADTEALLIAAEGYIAAVTVRDMVEPRAMTEVTFLGGAVDEGEEASAVQAADLWAGCGRSSDDAPLAGTTKELAGARPYMSEPTAHDRRRASCLAVWE